jgi:cysteine desulfurase/selenocysteine lyase
MNVEKIKKDFPIFTFYENNHKRLVFLDSASTSQKPEQVINAISTFYRTTNANVHRGLCELGEQATHLFEKSRERVAQFINADDSSEIVFTKGTTEGINFIAYAWALDHIKANDEIVVSQAEHHANLLPWQWVAKKTGANLVVIPYESTTGYFHEPESFLTEKTKLVAITCDSNVIGPVWDYEHNQLEDFIKAAHAKGALVLLDAAQTMIHRRVNIKELNPDFLVFSGHKMLGPTGVGVLYIKKTLHNDVQPYQRGGSMVHSATFKDAEWSPAPLKFEAGTPPIAEVIGLGAAIEYIEQYIDYQEFTIHEASLCSTLIDGLATIKGITIAGNIPLMKKHGYLVSFDIEGVHPHDLAAYLGTKHISTRAGHHCAQPFINALGFNLLMRVSFCIYNNRDDINLLLNELGNGIAFLRSNSVNMSKIRSNPSTGSGRVQ